MNVTAPVVRSCVCVLLVMQDRINIRRTLVELNEIDALNRLELQRLQQELSQAEAAVERNSLFSRNEQLTDLLERRRLRATQGSGPLDFDAEIPLVRSRAMSEPEPVEAAARPVFKTGSVIIVTSATSGDVASKPSASAASLLDDETVGSALLVPARLQENSELSDSGSESRIAGKATAARTVDDDDDDDDESLLTRLLEDDDEFANRSRSPSSKLSPRVSVVVLLVVVFAIPMQESPRFAGLYYVCFFNCMCVVCCTSWLESAHGVTSRAMSCPTILSTLY